MSAPVLSWLFHALKNSIATFLTFPESLSTSAVAHKHQLATSFLTRIFKPNPQSQSLSRGYGSILPTSLIYIILSTRGCTPWRPEAVMSTTRSANKSRYRIFKGRQKRTGRQKIRRFASEKTISPVNPIPWSFQLLKRKENSFQGFCQRLRLHLCYHSLSTSWFGNINPIPFR